MTLKAKVDKPRCVECGCYLVRGKCPVCAGDNMRGADAYIWRGILGIPNPTKSKESK
jgi:RNA polymerase subunit RPABC4/transcription elongation factor Spt4